jgi:hypothetical protein
MWKFQIKLNFEPIHQAPFSQKRGDFYRLSHGWRGGAGLGVAVLYSECDLRGVIGPKTHGGIGWDVAVGARATERS